MSLLARARAHTRDTHAQAKYVRDQVGAMRKEGKQASECYMHVAYEVAPDEIVTLISETMEERKKSEHLEVELAKVMGLFDRCGAHPRPSFSQRRTS